MKTAQALGLFILLTAVMTWPQARVVATEATPHQDVYFNMWRLEWFAHAVRTQPAHLFDANVFFPETHTLALSDAMIVEGAVAAPFIWAGARPVLVHNLLLLGAIALSGAAMFALTVYLTGCRGAGVLSGIVFAFAPYRFEHVMHMELQWAMWMPLAFLALHRTLDTGRMKYGLAAGACVALQILSSIYYGIFLALLIWIAAVLLVIRDRGVPFRQAALPLVVGGLLATAVSALYARPYMYVHGRTGDRPASEVVEFSARPADYLAATPNNQVYGGASRSGGPERRLFPGAVAMLLAAIGLLLVPPSRRAIVYLLLLVAAFETSLGFGGYSFSFLYKYVAVFRGLRALARLGVCVLMCAAVLAAYGYSTLAAARPAAIRRTLLAVFAAGMLLEYRVGLALTGFPNHAPAVYRALAAQPFGVVVELPAPRADALPGDDAEYTYMSTFHWFPLANGYSGVYPPSYLARLERLRGFPDDTSLWQLRADGVRYVIVHGNHYREAQLAQIRIRLSAAGMAEIGSFPDGNGVATLYRTP